MSARRPEDVTRLPSALLASPAARTPRRIRSGTVRGHRATGLPAVRGTAGTRQLPPRRQVRLGTSVEPLRQVRRVSRGRRGEPGRSSYRLPDRPPTRAVTWAFPARVPACLYAADGTGRTPVPGPPPIAAAPFAGRHGIRVRVRVSRTTPTATPTGADARSAYRPAPTP
ncbi:hypothetical protein [Streptomyces sp. AGS-58]|uniref:hypothetical protein n=1 Tax=unclassified Streptomyces TaxID=2593676 RepID=UPI0035A37444